MNGISRTRKLLRDVHWLVLNGNFLTHGVDRHRQLDDLDPLTHQVQVQVCKWTSP